MSSTEWQPKILSMATEKCLAVKCSARSSDETQTCSQTSQVKTLTVGGVGLGGVVTKDGEGEG